MAINIGDLVATLSLDDRLSKGLMSAGEVTANFGKGMMVAGAAATALGGAVVAAMVPAVKAAAEYETAMTKIKALTIASSEDVAKWGKDILELSTVVGKSPQELGDALYFIASSGQVGATGFEILKTSAKMAALGMGETAEIARALVSAVNAYGTENLSAAQAGDILTRSVIEGGAQADEYAKVLGRILPIASALGVGLDEVGAFMATFTRLGVKGSEAATALRGALGTLAAPGKQASEALATLGLSGEILRKKLAEEGLVAVLELLMEKTRGNVGELDKIIPNIRALTGVLGVAGEQGKEYARILGTIRDSNGQLEKSFGEWGKTTAAQWAQLQAALQAAAVQLGTALLPLVKELIPYLKSMAEGVGNAVKWFSSLSDETRKLIGGLLLFGGPALIALGAVVTMLGQLGLAIGALSAMGVTLAGVGSAIGAVLAFLVSPIGLVIAAVVALGAVWYKWGDDIKAIVVSAYETAKAWLVDAWEGSIFQSIWRMLEAMVGLFAAAWGKVGTYAQALYEVVVEWVVDRVISGVSKLKPVWDWLAGGWRWFADNVLGAVRDIYTYVKDWIVDKVVEAFSKLKEGIDKATSFFNGLREKLGYPAKEAGKAADDLAKGTENAGKAAAAAAPGVDKLSNSMKGYKDITSTLGSAVVPKTTEELKAMYAEMSKASEATQEQLRFQQSLVDSVTEAWRLRDAEEKARQEVEKMVEQGVRAKEAAQALYEAMSRNAEAAARSGRSMEQIKKQLEGTGLPAKDIETILSHLPPIIAQTADEQEKAADKSVDWKNAIEGVVMFAGMIGGNFGAAVKVIGNVADEFERVAKETDEGKKAAAQLQAVLSGIAQIGGLLESSTNPAIAKLGAALQGAAAGFKLGSSVGGIFGGVIGGVAGAIFGLFNKGKKLREEMEKLRGEFVQSVGGLDALRLKALQAGVSIEDIFKAKSKDQLLRAIDEVKAKLATWDEANQKLQAAIEKYGITVEELGPKFAQQQMDKQALDLVEAWKLLAAAGVDVTTLVEKMGPDMSKFVEASLNAGTTIPRALQGPIDALWKAGKLIHEDGTAFTEAEYNALKFGDSTSEMFESLLEKIDALVNALLGIPDKDVNVNVHTRYPNGKPPEPEGDGGGGPDTPPAYASGGIVTRPTLAYVGEAGPEAIIPLDQMGGGGATLAELRKLNATMANLPEIMRRALRDAMQFA